jgi:hypothetical protein
VSAVPKFLLAIAVALLARPSVADPVVGETSVEIRVGVTVSLDVGYARGLQCDDLTVVHAELRAASPTSNRLYLKGLRRGRTACRAGTMGAPTVLVHITVK